MKIYRWMVKIYQRRPVKTSSGVDNIAVLVHNKWSAKASNRRVLFVLEDRSDASRPALAVVYYF